MDIHDLLNSFIDQASPEAARFLCRMWKDQQKAVTYRELYDAIMDGSLDTSYLMDWQHDYSVFLTECYAPLVNKAVKSAKDALIAQYGGSFQDPMADAIDQYINSHGGRLIQNISQAQHQSINVLVRQATMTDTLTVDELARCIRPCIGLTQQQAQQVKRFYEQLREDGYSKKAALNRQASFAAKLHKERAEMIAQTEMAYAYNNGMDAVIRHNIDQGIIAQDAEKEWSAARDERVCPVCGELHGEKVLEGDPFSNGIMLPPAHPNCRCAVKYHLKGATTQEQTGPQEPSPDSEEWFEDGKVSEDAYEEAYDQIYMEMWSDEAPSRKEVREMVDSVYTYTTGSYTDILASEAGYGGRFEEYSYTMSQKDREIAEKNVQLINQYLECAPKHEGIVYRGLGFDVGGDYDQGSWELFRSAHRLGNTVSTDTMSSWTSRKSFMQRVIDERTLVDESAEYSVEVAMTMRDGATGVDISHIAEIPSQAEILFPKMQYKVTKYTEKRVRDDLLRVDIEVSEVLSEWLGF